MKKKIVLKKKSFRDKLKDEGLDILYLEDGNDYKVIVLDNPPDKITRKGIWKKILGEGFDEIDDIEILDIKEIEKSPPVFDKKGINLKEPT